MYKRQGHVSVITGSDVYKPLAERYHRPFVVTGFEAEHILASIYRIVRQIETGGAAVENLYRNAVKDEGNRKAVAIMEEAFETGPAMWRGLGIIEKSGLYLRDVYKRQVYRGIHGSINSAAAVRSFFMYFV